MSTEHRYTRRGMRSVIVGFAAALTMVVTGGGEASASAGSPGGHGDFATQARAAGLSRTQTGDLQARVEAYLAENGGTQVAANEIRYQNGSTLVLALPGERQARRLAPPHILEPQGCPYLNFCAYQLQNLGGDMLTAYFCDTWLWMPWGGNGSWVNNQTAGTQAQFRGSAGNNYNLIYTTWGAYTLLYSYNWSPVYWIDPC